jgi:hypothetical protein
MPDRIFTDMIGHYFFAPVFTDVNLLPDAALFGHQKSGPQHSDGGLGYTAGLIF